MKTRGDKPLFLFFQTVHHETLCVRMFSPPEGRIVKPLFPYFAKPVPFRVGKQSVSARLGFRDEHQAFFILFLTTIWGQGSLFWTHFELAKRKTFFFWQIFCRTVRKKHNCLSTCSCPNWMKNLNWRRSR